MYGVLRHSGLARWYRRSGAMVFCYHNVVTDQAAGRVGEGWLHTGVSEFRAQIDWIRESYTVVSLRELLARIKQRHSVSGLAVLTFDDGYRGLIRHGLPILRAAALPFALFPVSSTASEPKPFWWDHLGPVHVGERERLISDLQGDADLISKEAGYVGHINEDTVPASWQELRGILGDDCEIGVHTVTHRNLAPLPANVIASELVESRAAIANELNVDATVVAYPYGGTSEEVFRQVKEAGFEAGLGLKYGFVRPDADPLNLARVAVPAGMPMSNFACWGSGLKLRL